MRGEQVALRDVRIRARLRLDGHLDRVVEVVAGDLADRARHRRRKQRDLLVVWGVLQDAFNVFLEAHVQHLVGLIQDQEAQVGDVQRALLQVVDHTTRGAHDDLRTAAQPGKLDAVGLAAVNRQDVHAAKVVGERLEGVRHLQRQLARRREDQRLRVTLRGVNAA